MGWPWKPWFASRRMGSGRDGSLPSLRGKPAPLSLCRLQIKVKRDKKPCRLYSAENDMDPGSVPAELQGLSEVEELLIERAFPIMPIYRINAEVNGDTRETYSICLKILEVFWIASHLTSMACQSWWSGSKVQVSVSKIILHTGYCTL